MEEVEGLEGVKRGKGGEGERREGEGKFSPHGQF